MTERSTSDAGAAMSPPAPPHPPPPPEAEGAAGAAVAAADAPEPESGSKAEFEGGSDPEGASESEDASESEPAPGYATPIEAFEALYASCATPLVQQAYLLTGRRRLSREAVERAFHLAWQHWPEVATDADPGGWVRAAAHDYALSPWHRFRRVHRHPDHPPADPGLRALLLALLDLPPSYRRTLLLYDGLGLDLPETAAETQASTPAAASRLVHAREAVVARVPELAAAATPEALSELLRARIGALAAAEPGKAARLPGAGGVRYRGERRIQVWTRAAVALTAAVAGATAFTVSTAPTHYIPPVAPGQRVEGVPLNSGPQRVTEEHMELHRKLLNEPVHGPERLVPEFR
ncbi:sigma factor-like helix-turn-helix DNA-binding protein [Streptomyces sp. NPDC059070]|uniref:sigma factor-like helix-turn-helix DNA-binding protein n=1 Tax=Streptomyces sp. NPDC059070 TaxID=3346713 RepID=UPI0036C04602